jgi:hypothetical protein
VRCMGHGIFVLNMFGLYNLLLDCYLISYRLISDLTPPRPPARAQVRTNRRMAYRILRTNT